MIKIHTYKVIFVGFLVFYLVDSTAGLCDEVWFSIPCPIAVLERTDVKLPLPLVENADHDAPTMTLLHTDAAGQRHRIMAVVHGEMIRTPAYDGRLTIIGSIGPGSLLCTLRNVTQADQGIYEITVEGRTKYCVRLTVVKGSDIEYSIIVSGVSTDVYELSLGVNGTDVRLSGDDGNISVTGSRFLMERVTITTGETDHQKQAHRSANSDIAEQRYMKVAEILFAVQNCPPIRVWRARGLGDGNIGAPNSAEKLVSVIAVLIIGYLTLHI